MKSSQIAELLLPAAQKCDALLLNLPERGGIVLNPVFVVERGPVEGWVNQGFTFEPRHITFRNRDLSSATAFEEGKLLKKFMGAWATSRGWEARDSYKFGVGQVYLDYRYLLYKGAQRYLTGVGSGKLIEEIGFYNNARTPVRGVYKDLEWVTPTKEATHAAVKDLIKLADDVLPVRSEAWLRVFSGVNVTWAVSNPHTYVPGGSNDAAFARKIAGRVADIFERPCEVLGSDAWSLYLNLAEGSSFVEAVGGVAGALTL